MTNLGLDILGAGSHYWRADDTVRGWLPGAYAGSFGPGWPHAFGDPMPLHQRLYAEANCPGSRFHAWWDVTDNHAPPSLDFLKHNLPQYEQFALKNPNQRIYLSPACEYRTHDMHYIQQMISLVQSLAPHCTPVLCPEGGSPALNLPGVLVEQHGGHAHVNQNGIASTDGNGIADIDAPAFISRNSAAAICFLWQGRFNLREQGDGKPTPDKRTASPDVNYIKDIAAQSRIKGNPPIPTFHGPIIHFAKPNLYKTVAEDDKGPQPRDNKPLIEIMNAGTTAPAEVFTFDGKHIATFGHYGDVRWYSGWKGSNFWAYQIADRALALSGSSWVWFKLNGKFYGPVHGCFRAGFFQA